MGKYLGCGGYLTTLIRTKAGKFVVENSVALDSLQDISDVDKVLINPLNVLEYPCYKLNDLEVERVSHGMSLQNKSFADSDIVILVYSDKIYAIGKVEKNKILVKKVFEVI